MAQGADGAFFLGEDRKRDTAVGLDWEIRVGASSAVTAAPRLAARLRTKLRDGRVRVTDTIDVALANALPAATVVEIRQAPPGASLKVTGASAVWRLKDGDVTWSVPVPARAGARLRYQLHYIEG